MELKTNNMPGKSKKGGGLEVGSAYKMKGFSGFGNSPLTDKGEVVSKTSPGPGYTRTPGTNIWAPPKGKMMATMKQLKRKVGPPIVEKPINEMKPQYKKPVGPRAE